jgi:uracil-DNA glycosylase family 4
MTEEVINSTAALNRYFAHWSKQNNMTFDCGCAGKFDAEIAVVGNYASERDKALAMPFSGSKGETFWNAMRIEKLTKLNCYYTNAIKKHLKPEVYNDPTSVKASKEDIDLYGSLLSWELQQLPNLKYIIVTGEYAIKCVLKIPDAKEILLQGSVYKYKIRRLIDNTEREVTVVCVIDPDTVNKQSKFRNTLALNLQKFTRVITGQYKERIINTLFDQSYEFVIKYIRQLISARKRVALDIEIYNNETACIGLANKYDEALCINFIGPTGSRYTPEQELRIRQLLQNWFNRKDEFKARLVMQNGMFDSYYLWYKDRLRLPPSEFDTMLASHTLASTLPHNLAFLTSKYTDIPYYKDEGKTWRIIKDFAAFWNYNGKDCCATLEIADRQEEELRAQGLWEFFTNHVMKLQPELIKMTVGGVLADLEIKETLRVDIEHDLDVLKTKFYACVEELTGDSELKPNPRSSKQLADLFFTRLRLVGRGTATDAKNRQRMINHPKTPERAREMLLTLNDLAEGNKFLSTYVKMKVDEDQRIRCEYKQTGVQSAPGRLSSAQVMWGSGANLQNQPPKAQQLFLCDEGYELNYFDLSQAEARVVGWQYCIQQWIKDFERARIEGGYDAHRALAAVMWKMPYDEVPKEDQDNFGKPTIRYKAKRCRHGLNYTMQGPLLAEQIGVTVDEGEFLFDLYHRTNPELQEGWKWTYSQFINKGCLYNAFGRRYLKLEAEKDLTLGNIIAFYFQSTIGDKVSQVIYQCHNDPEWPKKEARLMLNIHDALISINRVEVGDTVRRILKKYAEEPIMIDCIDGSKRELIVPADFKKSVNYRIEFDAQGNKLKVPDKMRWSNLEKIKL